MGDIQQITDKYNQQIFKNLSYFNNLIKTVSLSRNSIGYKISKIQSIKNLSTSIITTLKTACNEEIAAFKAPLIVPIDTVKDTAVAEPLAFTNKKSLHIGINYTGTSNELNGCINDANNIASFIKTNYGFLDDNVNIMTDNTTNPSLMPTKTNILNAFTNLLKNGSPGDLLFFTYSGHGIRVLDKNNDELTKYDQCLVPVDLQYILDDEIKTIINANLKKGTTLFAIIDSCFSGTIFDLKYQYLDSLNNNMNDKNTKIINTPSQVIMISGCNDNQTSVDAYIENTSAGAMTWSFLSALTETKQPTWSSLLTTMRSKLISSEFSQIPQLSSGLLVDIDKGICVLTL